MTKVEELPGILGMFEGKLRAHPNPKLKMRALADGTITYSKEVDGETQDITIPISGVRVKIPRGPGSIDFRRYVRVKRGPKGNRDKIIGLVDKE